MCKIDWEDDLVFFKNSVCVSSDVISLNYQLLVGKVIKIGKGIEIHNVNFMTATKYQ